MASTHIEIQSTASRLSAELRSFIDRLNDIVNDGKDIKEIMDQVAMGSDWAALATKLGTSSSDAEAVYNTLGSVNTELAGPFIAQLTSRCG
jgi:hypothetical protein